MGRLAGKAQGFKLGKEAYLDLKVKKGVREGFGRGFRARNLSRLKVQREGFQKGVNGRLDFNLD